MFTTPLSLIFAPGMNELVIILIVVLVLFGGSKLPQLMKGMGTGIKEFKQAVRDDPDDPKKDETSGKDESGDSR